MDRYYWAAGEKVPLEPSDEVVVDLDSELAHTAPAGALRAAGRALTGSLLMLSRDAAEDLLGTTIATAPGIHPVFRSHGAQIAVLPQVRVEAAAPVTLEAIGRSLDGARVTEQSEDRLTIEPDSGRGEDALALANQIAESADVEVSQARFVRIVARPEP